MTRKEAINNALSCKGRIYTTDELWEDDENCVLSDSLGNLIYGNGELVENVDDLPLDGWWDATDNPDNDVNEDNYTIHHDRIVHEDVLYDPDDM